MVFFPSFEGVFVLVGGVFVLLGGVFVLLGGIFLRFLVFCFVFRASARGFLGFFLLEGQSHRNGECPLWAAGRRWWLVVL